MSEARTSHAVGRTSRLIAAIATCALLAAACGGDEDTKRTGSGSSADIPVPDEYVVGSILSLTGPASAFGETIKRTQDLFLSDLKEIDGVPLKVVVCDDASSPEGASACARRLVQQEDADLILGPHVAGPHQAAEPILARGPVSFTITPYVSAPTDAPIFAVTGQAIDLHTTTLEYAAEQGWDRIGVIATTDATGQVAVDQQDAIADELGLELKTERIDLTVQDASAQVASLKDFDPDAVVIWTTGRPAGVVFGALKQLQMEEVPVFTILSNVATGFLGSVAPVLPEELYVAASNVALPEAIKDSELRERVEDWQAKFDEEYGEKPDVVSTLMLDAWLMAEDVLAETHGDTDAAVAYLESVKDRSLFNWSVTFSPDNHNGAKSGNFTVVRLGPEGVAPL